MRTEIQTYFQIEKDLKLDFPDMSDYERLSLAVQIQRNQIIENGLNVSTDDSHPSALEAIAISLGFNEANEDVGVSRTLKEILEVQRMNSND